METKTTKPSKARGLLCATEDLLVKIAQRPLEQLLAGSETETWLKAVTRGSCLGPNVLCFSLPCRPIRAGVTALPIVIYLNCKLLGGNDLR